MEQNTVLTICIFVCMFTHQAYAVCELQSPFTISETAPNGTVIFNTTKPQGTSPSFTIKSPTQGGIGAALIDSLSLITGYTTFQLINSKVLDLEEFKLSYGVDIRAISLLVTCGGSTSEVFINVAGVNEYPPVFNNCPYNVTLNESLTVGSLVFSLRPRVTDSDVVGAENYMFAIQKYNIIDYDGASYFNIPESSTGDITLARKLDFDTMERSKLFVNLSVSDEPPLSPTAKTTYTTLEIHVADVDDQPPYFEYPDCPPPCPAPPYVSIIRLDHKAMCMIHSMLGFSFLAADMMKLLKISTVRGPLSVTPDIKGKMSDTLGTSLVYSIKAGDRHNLFNINPVTGVVNQIRSVNEAGLPDKEFRLIIEVKKDLSGKDLSSIAILTVKVYERLSDTDGCIQPPAENSSEDKGFNLTLFLIALGILSCSRSIFI